MDETVSAELLKKLNIMIANPELKDRIQARNFLPIMDHKVAILSAIDVNKCIIISGKTFKISDSIHKNKYIF
jgi:HrpA-like RNA helicase